MAEEIESKGGEPPVEVPGLTRPHGVTTERLVGLVRTAPRVDADLADELRAARASLGPVEDHWPP